MELKSYDKTWLPAFKGAFLIIFGIMAMSGVSGSVKSLAIMFMFLIALIGILLIVTGIRDKKSSFRIWTIISGIINLGFCIYISLHIDTAKDIYQARTGVSSIILIWVLFYALTELVEAGILVSLKNAFASLFVMNALLTLLFGYFLSVVSQNFNPQGVFYLGLIALVFGIVNAISSYLLSRIKA